MTFKRKCKMYAYALVMASTCTSCMSGSVVSMGKNPPAVLRTAENKDIIININDVEMARFIYLKDMDLWFGETETSIRQVKNLASISAIANEKYYQKQYGYTEEWSYFNVTDTTVIQYCKKLNSYLEDKLPVGYQFRPPTIEEWEAAARTGDKRIYPWGDNWPPKQMEDGAWPNLQGEDRAEYDKRDPLTDEHTFNGIPYEEPVSKYVKGYHDGYPGPCPVKKSGKNRWSIYGMGGNMSEWCLDTKAKIMVLKDSDFFDYQNTACLIDKTYVMRDQPYKFNPMQKRRRSHYGTGMRVVIGRKLNEELDIYKPKYK